jgi:hypothetical protein
MELFTACNNWTNRPDDERFKTMRELLQYCKWKRQHAKTAEAVPMNGIRMVVDAGDLLAIGDSGTKTRLTNHAFGQLCSKTRTIPKSVFDLETEMVMDILNYRIRKYRSELRDANMLFHMEDGKDLLCRAFTGTGYTRVWDYQIVEWVMPLMDKGWKVPPALTDKEKPSGLYASDRDLFIFLVNEDNRINDGTDEGIARGFFLGNSEVGGTAASLTSFLYRFICGNHIVWGAEDVKRFSVRHVGDANTKVREQLESELSEYANSGVRELEANIRKMRSYELGKTADAVEDRVFKARILPRKTIRAALNKAQLFEDIDGSPFSAWGLAQGVTRLAREEVFANKRTGMDTASGHILSLAN